jgi:methylglutaconyl-CoA hydratase
MLIDYKLAGAVARITLNRAEKRNAINEQMIGQLADALKQAAANKAVRVLVLTGAGQDFCAGMDIAMLRETANADVLQHMESAEFLASLFRALRYHPQPVVAAVRGNALGGGCGIATACDVVLAAESARFGYPEVKIGFVPAMVMSLLRRSVGEKRTFDLLVRGEPITAGEALAAGMITHVYPDSEFEAETESYVAAMAEKSASAVALTKRLLSQVDTMSFDAALATGVEVNAIARLTEDAQKGFEKFTKK